MMNQPVDQIWFLISMRRNVYGTLVSDYDGLYRIIMDYIEMTNSTTFLLSLKRLYLHTSEPLKPSSHWVMECCKSLNK